MKVRGLGLSAKKPYFKDRRSAIISIAVVAFLLVLAVLAIDRNNVRRLSRYHEQAFSSQEIVGYQLSQRFGYAATLASLLDERGQREPLLAITTAFETAQTIAEQSTLYRELETELAALQKELFAEPAYNQYAPYFDKMYEIEGELVTSIAAYNERAEFYNRQIHAFPASIVAKRLALDELAFYSVSSALKSRP
ncbi:MAG: hypothetical protein ACQ5SW_07345 [Sphaerochaetaceae bacterium]